MASDNVTGHWTGHYLQRDEQRPITADLIQTGDRLTGTMSDGHTDQESTLFDLALAAGLPPGSDEQLELKIRGAFPKTPIGPVRYVSHLPSNSLLEGRCKNQVISFIKTYQGACFSGYRAGDQVIGVEKDGHAVHYEGRFSADGLEIDGRWWIDADREHGAPRTEGLFSLRRQ
jgi:hypothetical protein